MLPSFMKPMLAVAVPEPFDSDHHLFEIKWDGIRCLAFVEASRMRLQSRELIEITAQFPELDFLARLPDGTVLDGEVVSMNGNRPCLAQIEGRALLQNTHRIELMSQSSPIVYVAFDLVYAHGEPLMAKPLLERRRHLEQLVSGFQGKRIVVSEAVLGQGRDLFDTVEKLGLEGIMAKSLDGPYRTGKRTALWKKIKVKGYSRQARPHCSFRCR